jgi:ribosomal protein L18
MVDGVSKGFSKTLEIQGVGYKAEAKPYGVNLIVGYSHPVKYEAPKGIKISVENNTVVKIEGADKEVVGQSRPSFATCGRPSPTRARASATRVSRSGARRQDRSQVSMRTIHAPKGRTQLRYRRHLRVRQKVAGTAGGRGLVVFRSLKHIYASSSTTTSASPCWAWATPPKACGQGDGKGKVARGKAVGKMLAEKAKAAGVTRWCSIRAGYRTMVACRPSPTARAKAD